MDDEFPGLVFLFISHSLIKDTFAELFFSRREKNALIISFCCLSISKVSAEKYTSILMEASLYVKFFFLLLLSKKFI